MSKGGNPAFFDPAAMKARLADLIQLAMLHRGWTQKALAEFLGRDVHNLVPPSGIPKLDLVLRLAEALEWTEQDVCEWMRGERTASGDAAGVSNWADLDRKAHEAILEGRHREAVEIARREWEVAASGEERARSKQRELHAWSGIGRYAQAIEACRQGLAQDGLGDDTLVALELNLAAMHYLLGAIREAQGVAGAVATRIESDRVQVEDPEGTLGFALYIVAQSHRVLAGVDSRRCREHAMEAVRQFRRSIPLLELAGRRPRMAELLGTAAIAEWALLECRVACGDLRPDEAIAAFLSALSGYEDLSTCSTDQLESIGWLCVFASNVAMRSIESEDELERLLAVFTNKADHVAELTGNWPLRERVWTIELARRVSAGRRGGGDARVLDRDDARNIAGAMSRFPGFRATGWRVLHDSRMIEG